ERILALPQIGPDALALDPRGGQGDSRGLRPVGANGVGAFGPVVAILHAPDGRSRLGHRQIHPVAIAQFGVRIDLPCPVTREERLDGVLAQLLVSGLPSPLVSLPDTPSRFF